MWIRQDLVERLCGGPPGATTDEARKLAEAAKKINAAGRGVCQYCKEDIVRNDLVPGSGWIWESEFMVGFCDKAGTGRKHTPMLVREPDKDPLGVELL